MGKRKDGRRIHTFAAKWEKAFGSGAVTTQEFEMSFGDECRKLGFTMDLGTAFVAKYPEASDPESAETLEMLKAVDDAELMGSVLAEVKN